MRRPAVLDGVPISEALARCDARFATLWWHWFFYARPDVPERAILADPDAWYGGDPAAMGAEAYTEYRAAGRRVRRPVLVLWSRRDDLAELYGDPVAVWRGWADEVHGHEIDSGHHMAEEAPEALAQALLRFFTRF